VPDTPRLSHHHVFVRSRHTRDYTVRAVEITWRTCKCSMFWPSIFDCERLTQCRCSQPTVQTWSGRIDWLLAVIRGCTVYMQQHHHNPGTKSGTELKLPSRSRPQWTQHTFEAYLISESHDCAWMSILSIKLTFPTYQASGFLALNSRKELVTCYQSPNHKASLNKKKTPLTIRPLLKRHHTFLIEVA